MKKHILQLLGDLKASKHAFHWVVILVVLVMSILGVQHSQLNLQVSILDLETPDPFDGTVYPVTEVPQWHMLTSAEYGAIYSEIPKGKLSSMPRYDADELRSEFASLGTSLEDFAVRNAKITYSVPYMGNYELDGHEYAGSHPAVDIKAPVGTPIVSIANGVVTKVSMQNSGFGHHVVIKHVNVPNSVGATSEIYSSYSHADEIFVSEGEAVQRGELIATVGNTGTSTTPHLHFQIDKNTPEWHPYWPFTYNDYASQGLSFFEAVNQGIGQENGIAHTINPMVFVQANLIGNGVSDVVIPSDSTSDPVEEDTPAVETPEEAVEIPADPVEDNDVGNEVENEIEDSVPVDDAPVIIAADDSEVDQVQDPDATPVKPAYALEIEHSEVFISGNMMEFDLIILNDEGQRVQAPHFDDRIYVTTTDPVVSDVIDSKLSYRDFDNGKATVRVLAEEPGEFVLLASLADTEYQSDEVLIRDEVKDVHAFEIEHDGLFNVGEAEVVRIIPVDEDGNQTSYSINGQVTVSIEDGDANLNRRTLGIMDFMDGYAEVTVTPTSEDDIVVRAQHSFIRGLSDELEHGAPLFTDVDESHENYEAIKKLKKRDVISGYPDGSFKPYKGVSRVEALKLIFAGFEQAVSPGRIVRLGFSDTSDGEWYSPFVMLALDNAVVNGYPDGTFKPAQTVNKAEFAKMLVLALDANIDMNDTSAHVADDVRSDDWFYPYVRYLVEEGILDLSQGKFYPAEAMDRAKVAEAIYRITE